MLLAELKSPKVGDTAMQSQWLESVTFEVLSNLNYSKALHVHVFST